MLRLKEAKLQAHIQDELDPALAAQRITTCDPGFTLYHAAEPSSGRASSPPML
jgi:hypothetical protein